MGTVHPLKPAGPPPVTATCKCGLTVITLTKGYPGSMMALSCGACNTEARAVWPLDPPTTASGAGS